MQLDSPWHMKSRVSVLPHLSTLSLGAGANTASLGPICVRSGVHFLIKSLGARLRTANPFHMDFILLSDSNNLWSLSIWAGFALVT